MAFNGSEIVDSDNGSMAVQLMISLIADHADQSMERLTESKEPGLLGCIACLRVLADAFHSEANCAIRDSRAEAWEKAWREWTETRGAKIPKKYREHFLENAATEFRLLRGHLS